MLEDSFGNTQLAGAIETEAKSTADILSAIDTATKYRKTESTQKNDSSSRSHAICRLRIEQHDAEPGSDDGILYLVDLAGSEAARDRTAHTTDRMKESREINVSLSVLKDCIRGKIEADATVAARRKRPYIPFRQSALTKVLKHVFDPSGTRICKNVFMACVNPCLLDLQASRNTLRYAEMLRVFLPPKVEAKYDRNVPMTWSNEELQAYIRSNVRKPQHLATRGKKLMSSRARRRSTRRSWHRMKQAHSCSVCPRRNSTPGVATRPT